MRTLYLTTWAKPSKFFKWSKPFTTPPADQSIPSLFCLQWICMEWKRCPLQVVAGPFAPRPSPHVEPGFGLPGHRNLQAPKTLQLHPWTETCQWNSHPSWGTGCLLLAMDAAATFLCHALSKNIFQRLGHRKCAFKLFKVRLPGLRVLSCSCCVKQEPDLSNWLMWLQERLTSFLFHSVVPTFAHFQQSILDLQHFLLVAFFGFNAVCTCQLAHIKPIPRL